MRGLPILIAAGLATSACYHLAYHFTPRRAESAAPRVYAERCSTCHGASGRGDGLAGASLDPRPRDFEDAGWQAAASDEHIRQVIRGGGAAVGRSPLMPAHADLSEREVGKLLAYIREVGARGAAAAR